MIKIGTRGSNLALKQTNDVKNLLKKAHGLLDSDFEIIIIKTSGDLFLQESLAKIGGKGLFTKEIEEKLLNSEIDFAVHSLKDMPVENSADLAISKVPLRESFFDLMISKKFQTIEEMEPRSKIGTSSSRRKMQILALRKDLQVVPLRGNVNGRIQKLMNGEIDAILLAEAGINRLNLRSELELNGLKIQRMPISQMLPAACQGALALQCRKNDHEMLSKLNAISDINSQMQIEAEKAFIEEFGGSCTTPIAALAIIEGNILTLECQFFDENGFCYSAKMTDDVAFGKEIGKKAAREILSQQK